MSKKDRIFVLYAGVFTQKGKKVPDVNVGFFLKPNVNGKFSMYAEIGLTKGKGSGFLKTSYAIGQKQKAKKPEVKNLEKKSIFPRKTPRRGKR